MEQEVSMHIQWVLFDLGGVLYDIDLVTPIQTLKKLASANTDGNVESRLQEFHREFMKGRWTEEQFFLELQTVLGLRLETEAIRQIWDGIIVGFREEFRPLLQELRKNTRVALLSNTDSSHMRKIFYQVADFANFFDRMFLSYQLNAIKPEEIIFRLVLEEIRCKPEEVIFFDDSRENVVAAREMGMHALEVRSFEEVMRVCHQFQLFNQERGSL